MEQSEILKHIDHTNLKPFLTWDNIKKLCNEAIQYEMASICIPPCYVKNVKEEYGEKINICTVIGFPLGYNTLETKVFEAKQAIKNGAKEIDMVVNISFIKNKQFDLVEDEIYQIKQSIGNNVLKVIIETCYLTNEEKIKLCEIVTKAGADFIKTSTGFGTKGATFEDIKIFFENVGQNVKVKAAGGVKTINDIKEFLSLGCERIGTSSAINLIQGKESDLY